MFDSGVFNYVNVLDKAADSSWDRHDAIINNIANAQTPDYKRTDISFEAELKRALGSSGSASIGDRVGDVDLSRIEGEAYTDSENFSYRLDGNNVDIDTENVMMAANKMKYDALIQCISGEFSGLQSVMKG